MMTSSAGLFGRGLVVYRLESAVRRENRAASSMWWTDQVASGA